MIRGSVANKEGLPWSYRSVYGPTCYIPAQETGLLLYSDSGKMSSCRFLCQDSKRGIGNPGQCDNEAGELPLRKWGKLCSYVKEL